jgi:hypothetical protein
MALIGASVMVHPYCETFGVLHVSQQQRLPYRQFHWNILQPTDGPCQRQRGAITITALFQGSTLGNFSITRRGQRQTQQLHFAVSSNEEIIPPQMNDSTIVPRFTASLPPSWITTSLLQRSILSKLRVSRLLTTDTLIRMALNERWSPRGKLELHCRLL